MPVRFAINGLGRMGRALLRIAAGRDDLRLVAVNDLAGADQLARLLRHDTLHGRFEGEVAATDGALEIDGRAVQAFREPDPANVPWPETDAEVVVDATGRCKTRERALGHLRGPVRKVVVSANAEGMDLTICVGVNHGDYDPAKHHLLSGASCTTNCLVPLLWLLDRDYGIEAALLDTVHSYNNDQRLLESPHPDPRRARSAALNMVPTTTSAIGAAVRILPGLEGKLAGFAVRVPTPNVSLVDLVVRLRAKPTTGDLTALFRAAAAGELAGVLATTEEELVSSDFLRDSHSAIVDLPLTQAVGGELYRVVAWYDNEWGHASRLADLVALAGKSAPGASAPERT